jgi:prevent-host-death family protein
MRSVSATAAKQNFAAVLDDAQREPVMIRRHDRNIAVVLSTEDYDRLRGANVAEYLRIAREIGERAVARGMNEQVLQQLLADDDQGEQTEARS